MIRTVNGEILQTEMGITMCHEHLALSLARVRGDDDSDFRDINLVIEEVKKMVKLGVASVIEVTCNDMGRDVKALQEISRQCGLHIVAATGFYLEPYHSDFIKGSNAEEIAEIFCKDILQGIDGTNIKAGIIGEVATSEKEMAPSEKTVLKAAAMAAKETGCAVTTHCQLGRLAMEQSRMLQEIGMNPDKIILGHLDLAADLDYYEKVLKTDVNIGFDTIGKTAYISDDKRADYLIHLIEKGYEDHIVLSQDISRKSYFSKFGKYHGYTTVMGHFVPLLTKRGIKKETLDKLLITNPGRILNIAK